MNKTIICLIAVVLVLAASCSAEAATAELHLDLDDSLVATAVLEQNGNGFKACRVTRVSPFLMVDLTRN